MSLPRDYSVLDALPEGAQVMDRDWRYLYLNDVVVGQSGYSREQLLGRTFLEMYPGVEDSQLFAALETCMRERRVTRTTNDFVFPDGTRAWFQLRAYPVEEGILIFSLDVTEAKAQQLIIEEMNAELEALVERRTAELEARNAELMQLNYLVSHDLQAPLRTIHQFADRLKTRSAGQLDDRSQTYVERIGAGAARLQKLVGGMMQHGRLGSSSEVEEVDLQAMLDELTEDLEATLEAKGAAIEAHGLPTVRGYAAELRLLLQNLVANGLKFSRDGVPPRVGVSAKRASNSWVLSVSDNGIGIDPKHHERIFGLFQRLHSADEFPGTGLGLAHCAKIVGLHGGRLSVESTPGQGSTFSFTLPDPTD